MSFRDQVAALQGESLELRAVLATLNQDADPRGTTYYVDAYDGQNGNDGKSWTRPFLTMAKAFTTVKSGDTIRFRGKVTEELTTPVQVFDVTVIGDSNRTRHADATPADPSGKSHGASWQVPASPTSNTPLCKVLQQGWTFANILFDAHSDSPCVQLFSDAGSGNSERDASHASFYNCKFANAQEGIESVDGQTHVLIDGCEFNALTTAVSCASTGVRVNSYWDIRNSTFINNTNHIKSSFNYATIKDNVFGKFTTTAIKTTENSGQGGDNVITRNALSGTYSIAGGYTGASSDEWGGNYNSLSGGVTASDPA